MGLSEILVHLDVNWALATPAPVEAAMEADVAAPAMVRHLVRPVAGPVLGEERLHDVLVSVSEAVANVVHHAYGLDRGRLTVKAWTGAGVLAILVRDQGRGMPVPASRGLGMTVMRELADGMRVFSMPGAGTAVLLVFRTP